MSVSVQIPYSQVHAHGNILFAARSGQLHTYSLTNGKLISIWKHPDVAKVAEAVKLVAEEKEVALATGAGEDDDVLEDDKAEPPAKRQKMLSEEESSVSITTELPPTEAVDEEASSKGQRGKGEEKGTRHRQRVEGRAKVPDRPLITHLAGTPDKKHVVAVTGHDKAVWVFEHDGQGHFKELSSRSVVFGNTGKVNPTNVPQGHAQAAELDCRRA
jgi:tRNA (guanine-N(7)-)-methyltransferase subunit TRM82